MLEVGGGVSLGDFCSGGGSVKGGVGDVLPGMLETAWDDIFFVGLV